MNKYYEQFGGVQGFEHHLKEINEKLKAENERLSKENSELSEKIKSFKQSNTEVISDRSI